MRKKDISPAHALIHGLRVMSRITRRHGKKPGAPPGTIVHTGHRRVEQVQYQLFEYSDGELREQSPLEPAECFPLASPPAISWLNVDGLHETDALREMGERAGLHTLVLEDVVSIGQRPKLEEYESQLFIVLRMLSYNEPRDEIEEEQISIVLGANYVLSFQEAPGDVFDPVRERLRKGKGVLRSRPADYLAYALIDAIVDEYFVVLEKVADRLEELGNEVVSTPPRPSTIHEIHHLRRELILMRKAVWPVRDLLGAMIRDESGLISPPTKIFMRDAYDHAVQVIDTVETLRDLVSGLVDIHLSATSNRMNEVMKVLTIIATIFIPLTFVAGVYGMNFESMPELTWPWGYPAVLLVMALMAAGMLVYFRRKGWI